MTFSRLQADGDAAHLRNAQFVHDLRRGVHRLLPGLGLALDPSKSTDLSTVAAAPGAAAPAAARPAASVAAAPIAAAATPTAAFDAAVVASTRVPTTSAAAAVASTATTAAAAAATVTAPTFPTSTGHARRRFQRLHRAALQPSGRSPRVTASAASPRSSGSPQATTHSQTRRFNWIQPSKPPRSGSLAPTGPRSRRAHQIRAVASHPLRRSRSST